MERKVDKVLRDHIANGEIPGAVLLVRKDGKLVYDRAFGYADVESQKPVTKKTMFRLASMTKPICGIAVMQLVEAGQLGLYDPISRFIPEFAHMKCCAERLGDDLYQPDPENPAGRVIQEDLLRNIKLVDADRPITVFDLLTHSSGLGMESLGIALCRELSKHPETIQQRAVRYAAVPLDFQPGTGSGYSAAAGFEVLSALVEIISGEQYSDYLKDHIFERMGIEDITYCPTAEQQARIPKLYQYNGAGKGLSDVSDTEEDWISMDPLRTGFCSASAALYGTVEDYEKIAHMLLDRGSYEGNVILRPETVDMMAGKNIPHTSRMQPGIYWGLSMCVMDDPVSMKSSRASGSYGWSGAYGTHFFVDPKNKLEMVLGINRSNIGGAASYVSFAVEDALKEDLLE